MERDPVAASFGELLRRCRIQAGLTQEALAEAAGMSARGISDLESGRRTRPRRYTVDSLMKALGAGPVERQSLLALAGYRKTGTARAQLPSGGFLGAVPIGPLLGRETEQRRMMTAIESVLAGEGRLVLLTGEAGVGKTRLAQEAMLALHARGILTISGACYASSQGAPFRPFLPVLDRLYEAAPETVRAAIPADWPLLSHLLPDRALPSPRRQPDQDSLTRTVIGFIRAMADHGALAILLDDLQWADGASLSVLPQLARSTRDTGVFLLGTCRDLDGETFREDVALELHREGLVEIVPLKRLTAEPAAALLAASIGCLHVPLPLRDWLYQRTDGNPFFILELVRELTDDGVLGVAHGEVFWEPPAHFEVPTTVRALIAQRLRRLPHAAQEVLCRASILGARFSLDLLFAISGAAEEETIAALEGGEEVGLVRRTGHMNYAFNHALTHETLYRLLPRHRRRVLHLTVARRLESLPPDRQRARAGEIAHHWAEGGELAPAYRYRILAGEYAMSLFAPADAEHQYRAALQIANQIGDWAAEMDAAEHLGHVLSLMGRYEESLAVLRPLEVGYRAVGDLVGLARVTTLMGRVHGWHGTANEGIATIEPLLGLTMDGGDRELAALHIELARLYFFSGRYQDQLRTVERGIALAQRSGDRRLEAEGEIRRGVALDKFGRHAESIAVTRSVIPLIEGTGDVDTLIRALHNLAWTQKVVGELRAARANQERALALSRQTCADAAGTAFEEVAAGDILFLMGRWVEARECLSRAAALVAELPNTWFTVYPTILRGRMAVAQGKSDEVRESLAACIETARERGDLQAARLAAPVFAEAEIAGGSPENAARTLRPLLDPPGCESDGVPLLPALAHACLQLNDLTAAGEAAREAVRRSRAEGSRLYLVDALRILGMVAATEGACDAAEEALTEALQVARDIGYPYAEARAAAGRGAIAQGRGQRDVAQRYLTEAATIFAQLGVDAAVDEVGACGGR